MSRFQHRRMNVMDLDLLWNNVKENILDVLFPKNISALSVPRYDRNTVLAEQFARYGTSPHIYPLLCDRIEVYVSDYYKNVLLPYLLPLHGFDLLKALRIKWNTCKYKSSALLMHSLKSVYKVYLETDWHASHVHPQLSIIYIVQNSFRQCIYNVFAYKLRADANNCIKDDVNISITNGRYLHHYLSLIRSLAGPSIAFCKHEWDDNMMKRIMFNTNGVIASRFCDSISNFLKSVERNLSVYKSVFLLKESKKFIEESFLKAVKPIRNSLLFQNGGEALNNMVQRQEGLTDLKRLARIFEYDDNLIYMMTQHYTKCFRSYIYGEGDHFSSILLSEEGKGVVRRILDIWQKIDAAQQVVGQSKMIRASIVSPFMNMIASPKRSAHFIVVLETALADYMDELLFSQTAILELDVENELWKLLSLASNLPDSDTFKRIGRDMLSTHLRNGWTPNNNAARAAMEYLVGDSDSANLRFTRMLRDVRSWPVHAYEMRKPIREFQKKYSTEVDLQVIQRTNWPNLSSSTQLRLPAFMAEYEQIFQQHFSKEHEERLASIDSLGGRAVIKCQFWTFRGENVRLEGSTGQMCVLEQFQEAGPKTVGDICKNIALDQGADGMNVIIGILESLMGTVPVLVRCGDNNHGGPLEEGDKLEINFSYKPTSFVIRLPEPTVADQCKKRKKEGNEWVREFRETAVQSMVMRCLKENLMMEMGDLERMVSEKLVAWYDAREVGLMVVDVVNKLAKNMDVELDGKVVRYIP